MVVCAEDGEQRSDLVRSALDQWRRATDVIAAPRQVVLVGDTRRDVGRAQEVGTLVLAVATGRYSVDALREARPDRVVRDLTDANPLRELISSAVAAAEAVR